MSAALLIRADASREIGTGHVMRMLALAQASLDRGCRVTLLSVQCPAGVEHRVRREKIGFTLAGGGRLQPGSAEDLAETIAAATQAKAGWIILDGYNFGLDYQRALRAEGFRVMAIDDYGHCARCAADAVLNQNIFAPELSLASEVEGCHFLLGTRFALLRREFRRRADQQEPSDAAASRSDGRIRRVLITLGGADAENVTARILQAFASLRGAVLELRVIAGPSNPHLSRLKELARGMHCPVDVIENADDMPQMFEWADGVISAGGSTCWEWMFYRLPACVVCLADNQRPVIEGLAKYQLALDLGWHADLQPEHAAELINEWLEKGTAVRTVPTNVSVDAYGAERVASVLDGTFLRLRRVKAADAELWYRWANDPDVRANGFHQQTIPWETHCRWFELHRRSPESRLWIGFDLKDQALGYARLHKLAETEWEVGVAVAPEHRGQNAGRRLVSVALRQFFRAQRDNGQPCPTIVARIKPENVASLKLFRSAGFLEDAPRSTAEYCVLTHKSLNDSHAEFQNR